MIEPDLNSLGDPAALQFHVIQQLPTSDIGGRYPILFVEASGGVLLHPAAHRWMRHRQFETRESSRRNDIAVLGRLFDFWQVVWRGQPVHPDDASLFIWAYLDARHHGETAPYPLALLGWKPVAHSSALSDLRVLKRYLEFLRTDRRADDPIFGLPRATLFQTQKRKDPPEYGDFFQHLRQARHHWALLFGETGVRTSFAMAENRCGGSTFSLDRTLDYDEALEIIRCESNPVYRALWILCCFGGLRISESLHMWQCDVLPPATAATIGAGIRSSVMVVAAHPSMSPYLGDFTRIKETRAQFLARQYGRLPRHHLSGYRFAGWKNPLLTDDRMKLSEVFWCDQVQAEAFAEAYAEVRHWHTGNRTSQRHPYLWVNLNRGAGFGEPVAYRKVYEAFKRACRRVGLEPSVSGRRIHGGRHLYNHILEQLKLPPRFIQIAMRHRSIASQENYGQQAVEIRRHLQASLVSSKQA